MEWVSILPPVLAILVVLWCKEVIIALFAAIILAEWLLAGATFGAVGPAWLDAIERIAEVCTDISNTRLLMFSLIIGALLAFIRQSGGIAALVKLLIDWGIAKNGRRSGLLASAVGYAIFVEANLSILTSGILTRGLFDKFGMSRARLAYIIDSTAAPVSILVLLNGWGAYILALLNNYTFDLSLVKVLWGSVPYNFYAIFTLLLVFYTAYTGRTYGPLKHNKNADKPVQSAEIDVVATKARYMLVPLGVLIFGMVGFMYMTGNGDLSASNGSQSVLYAVVLACLVAYSMMLVQGKSHLQLAQIGFKGMGELLPLVAILLLALSLGASLKALGTGIFVAGLVGDYLSPVMIAPVLFITGALISFSTGTSWGTFAILIPLGVPLIHALGLPPGFILAAILGGGVFGDHCSPISDTTAVSAMASGCDLLEHVHTQLPYALTTGVLATVAYLVTGIIIL